MHGTSPKILSMRPARGQWVAIKNRNFFFQVAFISATMHGTSPKILSMRAARGQWVAMAWKGLSYLNVLIILDSENPAGSGPAPTNTELHYKHSLLLQQAISIVSSSARFYSRGIYINPNRSWLIRPIQVRLTCVIAQRIRTDLERGGFILTK